MNQQQQDLLQQQAKLLFDIDQRLRIGITCYPTTGGSGVVATELGKLLAQRGHEVHFISSSIPFRLGRYDPNIYFHEVQVNQYSVFRYPPYDLTLANKMAQVAGRFKLDILHVHYAIPHAICAFLAKQMTEAPLKVVTTLHGTDITVLGYDESLKDMIRFGIEKSDAVTAVSRHLIQETNEIFHTDRQIECIYNFVQPQEEGRQKSGYLPFREYHLCNGEKLVVHISNFRPVKRVPDVGRVFKYIADRLPARLVLIGDGPELHKLRQWLQSHDLDRKVIFLGEQENVADILPHTDLMLLPSEKESFGLVALEAMASGVPVIASDTGGIPEVVAHGETGYTLPVGAVEQMGENAVRLLQDEQLYERMSRHARERSLYHFNALDIVSQYIQLYRRIIAP